MARAATRDKAAAIAAALAEYADDPASFCKDFLGVELWEKQVEAASAVVTHKRVTIRSGHGVGKSHLLACLILWMICTHPKVEGLVTAPTYRQLTTVVFRKVKELLDSSLLKDFVDWKPTRVAFGTNLIQAATARKGEGLQGIHADPKIGSVFIIIEEASGVPESFFDALEGALSTGDAYIIMVGNPTQLQGRFYESHHSLRQDWYTMQISAEEAPFTRKEWLEARKKAWGEDSDTYRVRVRGEFPRVDGYSLIPLQWMEDCKLITDTPHAKLCGPTDSYVIGVDPARSGGDSTFVTVRRGHYILAEFFAQFKGMGVTDVAGYVRHLYEDLKKISPVSPNTGVLIRPIVCVDAVGIGAGVYDILRDAGVNVREVQASAKAPDTDPPCHRMRDFVYWQCRELFDPEQGIEPIILIPGKRNSKGLMVAAGDKAKLVEEMIAQASGLRYKYLPNGAVQVEDKDSYRQRNSGRSPDAADSLALTFMRDNRVPKRKVVDIFERARRRAQEQGWH